MDATHLNLITMRKSYYWFLTVNDVRTREIIYLDKALEAARDLAWTEKLYDGIF